eukprot:GHVS01099295.1.p2 GENE.GHVS01099295.1~~GHVS01099295.1.p2  ORF type:complete len:174 (-),score=60.03 GHVS01099295.1:640-1161(-)
MVSFSFPCPAALQRRFFCDSVVVNSSCSVVADLGCGEGRLVLDLFSFENFTTIVGIDIDSGELDRLNQQMRERYHIPETTNSGGGAREDEKWDDDASSSGSGGSEDVAAVGKHKRKTCLPSDSSLDTTTTAGGGGVRGGGGHRWCVTAASSRCCCWISLDYLFTCLSLSFCRR